MVIANLFRQRPLRSKCIKLFSTSSNNKNHSIIMEAPKYDTSFNEPLEDYEFDSVAFSQTALDIVNKQCVNPNKAQLQAYNDKLLKDIQAKLKYSEDPFKLIEEDLKRTKEYAITNILRTEYKQLEDPALYNMNLKGKNFRSAILFMLSRAIFNNQAQNAVLSFDETLQYQQVKTLAACIEIVHNSSLLQDDIIDKADSRRSQVAAHKIYGASNTVFSSDFMIARASRMLAMMFETTHISQIFSTVLYNLVYGELIQAKRDMKRDESDKSFNVERYFDSYISKTYYKTASMISLGCRGLGVIFGLDNDAQRKLFDFGAHLGIAFQVHDDILDFTQDSAQLGKPAFNDIKEGIITAPLVYTFVELKNRDPKLAKEFEEMMNRKFQESGDVTKAVDELFNSCGIELADRLSIEHINLSLENLRNISDETIDGHKHYAINLEDEKYAQALMALALKVKVRKF